MAEWEWAPCTPAELLNIISFPVGGGVILPPDTGHDLVHPHIIIGEEDAARDISLLRRLGVTHVLNAAHGTLDFQVNTNPDTYRKARMKFLGIDAMDFQNFQLTPFFQEASDFIADAVDTGGKLENCARAWDYFHTADITYIQLSWRGRVMVHCRQGMSRSATLVLAYLMLREHMTVQEAVRLVRANRNICPNDGFLQQLCDLNESLKHEGHFKQATSTDETQTVVTDQQDRGDKDGTKTSTATS